MSTTTRKPRRKAPLQADQLEAAFDQALRNRDAALGENEDPPANEPPMSATELRVISGAWRKLFNYLNDPPESATRQEAEAMLAELGMHYIIGENNARHLVHEDTHQLHERELIADIVILTHTSLRKLAEHSAQWQLVRIYHLSGPRGRLFVENALDGTSLHIRGTDTVYQSRSNA